MLRRDGKVQCIAGVKSQDVLIGKPRRRSELPSRHGQHGEAFGDQLVEYGERRRALLQIDPPGS